MVTSLVDQFAQLVKLVLEAAKLYETTLLGGLPDVLKTVESTLLDVLTQLLNSGQVHVLFIPIGKQFPIDIKIPMPTQLEDVALQFGFSFEQAGIVFRNGADKGYQSLLNGTGGNGSFFRTFVQALNNIYDLNAPQFTDSSCAVVMQVLMTGAPDITTLLKTALAFDRLFKPPSDSSFAARINPTPQNLRVSVVPVPMSNRIGVSLTWDVPQAEFKPPYFGGVTMKISRYAIIRCTDPDVALRAQHVTDFFTTQDLSEGLTSNDEDHASQVVDIGPGPLNTFVDSDPSLNKNDVYFYFVAWETIIIEGNTTTVMPFDRVSNHAKTHVRSAPPDQKIVPPRWISFQNVLGIIPALQTSLDALTTNIYTLVNRQTGGASASVTAATDMLLQTVERYIKQISALNAQIERLQTSVLVPLPGLFATTITGNGGNGYLIGELASRLSDTSDDGRPPYDGNEFVMGICIVAGGLRPPDVQPTLDFLQELFQPPTPTSPLQTILNTLDQTINMAEQAYLNPTLKPTTPNQTYFDPAMQPYPINADGTVTLADGTTVDPNTLNPLTGLPVPATFDPATGNFIPAVTPVVSDDGTPVAALDPLNPYTGDP